MEPLFALSIEQPWLEMILRGEKTLEVRMRNTRRRGRIALHAPWRIDFSAAYFFGFQEPWRLPRAGIVAVAEIVEVHELDESSSVALLRQHRQPIPLGGGSYGIELRGVQQLARLVKCPGKPGFFPLKENISRRVLEMIELSPNPAASPVEPGEHE
jgi:hypothetical protein